MRELRDVEGVAIAHRGLRPCAAESASSSGEERLDCLLGLFVVCRAPCERVRSSQQVTQLDDPRNVAAGCHEVAVWLAKTQRTLTSDVTDANEIVDVCDYPRRL